MRWLGSAVTALVALVAIALGAATAPDALAQQAAWLDGPLAAWNSAGMAVPRAPQGAGFGPVQCQTLTRPSAGAEEGAVASAGWQLTRDWPAQRRGGTAVVMATADFDGMCRPLGFNGFVFEGGRFAGMIAPEPMGSRSDGTLVRPPAFLPDGRLDASFVRFAPTDPLCCPSRAPARLLYRIEQRAGGPVLIAERPAAATGSGMRLPITGWGGGVGGSAEVPPASGWSCSTLDALDERCSTD